MARGQGREGGKEGRQKADTAFDRRERDTSGGQNWWEACRKPLRETVLQNEFKHAQRRKSKEEKEKRGVRSSSLTLGCEFSIMGLVRCKDVSPAVAQGK